MRRSIQMAKRLATPLCGTAGPATCEPTNLVRNDSADRTPLDLGDRAAAQAHFSDADRCGTALHRAVRADLDLDVADINNTGETARQVLARINWTIHADLVDRARGSIAGARLDFVRHRALQVCIGLYSQRVDALQLQMQMCEILQFSCGPVAPSFCFTSGGTAVKHFQLNIEKRDWKRLISTEIRNQISK
jgi:hypothetical protein